MTVVVTKRYSDGIPAPTISIRVINPSTSDGLTKDTNLKKACARTESNTSVEDCIKKNTFSQEDVLHDIIFGFRKRKSMEDLSLMNNKSFLINEDFAAFFFGRYYTFNLEMKLNTFRGKTQLFISLYQNFTYQLFIYDPKFFVLSSSPALPTIQKTLNPNTASNSWHFLKLTEVEELDTADDPCNDDLNYDFHRCVTESLSTDVSSYKYNQALNVQTLNLFFRCASIS